MIKRFYAKNYCSIKEKVDISFEASKTDDDTFYNNVFKYKDSDVLKVSAFYGMNASGKTSIVKALAALRELAIGVPVLPYAPFEFDDRTKTSPIELGIEFSLNNNDDSPIYKYNVSFSKDIVLTEKLEKMTSQKPSLLYERLFIDNKVYIKFGTIAQNNVLLDAIKQSVIPNKTFLSMFNQFKVADFYDAYDFFATRFINISPEVTRFDDYLPNNIMVNENLKDFVTKLLKAADFNIDSISIDKTQMNIGIPNVFMPGFKTEKDTLFFVHKGENAKGSIEFVKESLGTKKITILAEHLYPVLSKPSVLVVDELESSLHPELTKMIIRCFLDETINPFKSQLIFTSHETALLNLNLLRRDEINFVYKDEGDCSTYIKSLKEFHARKGENIEKAYLAGRYLTSPNVKDYQLTGVTNE